MMHPRIKIHIVFCNITESHIRTHTVSWDTVISYLEPVMKAKAAPVHSIEPQILQAALQAKADGNKSNLSAIFSLA